jgi:hypothetical protein
MTWLLLGWSERLPAQGYFEFWNPGAPTYVGYLGGPRAGPEIRAQALVGSTSDSLTPLETPTVHSISGNGLIVPLGVDVPFSGYYTYVQVQMAVWDGLLWGTNFANVPASQIGYTDIVPVFLVHATDGTIYSPRFTQSAVVPDAPEPGVVELAVFGGAALALTACRRGRS